MKFHEAANLFPMDDESLGELMEDIRKHGQRQAVELLNGEIIDGRRRATACNRLGLKIKTVDVDVDDPIAYVLSLNLHRRHLSASQKAMVGQKAKDMYAKQAKERQRASKGQGIKGPAMLPDLKGDARDLAGKAVGVSGKLIDHADKVVHKGIPELAKAVEEGRMSVTSASKLAELDEDIQEMAAGEATFSGGRFRQKKTDKTHTASTNGKKAVGIERAYEALNCLTRIPKNDPERKRGFQIVADWIEANS
jgi:hypothetical protein